MGNFLATIIDPKRAIMAIVAWFFREMFHRVRNCPEEFSQLTGMTAEQFDWLTIEIQKMDQYRNQTKEYGKNLAITLGFFARGATPQFWGAMYSKNADETIRDTTILIFKVLRKFVNLPGEESYARIASEFQQKYGIQNCVGSIGFKRIEFLDNKSGIELVATCDKDLRFVLCTVNEEVEDKKSTLGKAAATGKIPPVPSGHYLIGDPGFKSWKRVITKPTAKIPEESFAAIQSLIPQAFKLLSSKWTVLKNPIQINDPVAILGIIACLLALHNWLICESLGIVPDREDKEETDEEANM